MEALKAIDLEAVRAASGDLSRAREKARADALATIHAVQGALCTALGDEQLRGLANLTEDWKDADSFRGANVRAANPDKLLSNVAKQRPDLVLLPTGILAYARRVVDHSPTSAVECSVTVTQGWTEYVRAEDLEAYLRTLAVVLPRHVSQARTAAATFKKVSDLARVVEGALQAAGFKAPPPGRQNNGSGG